MSVDAASSTDETHSTAQARYGLSHRLLVTNSSSVFNNPYTWLPWRRKTAGRLHNELAGRSDGQNAAEQAGNAASRTRAFGAWHLE